MEVIIRCTHVEQVRKIAKIEGWWHWTNIHFRECAERTFRCGCVYIIINKNGQIGGNIGKEYHGEKNNLQIIDFLESKYSKQED